MVEKEIVVNEKNPGGSLRRFFALFCDNLLINIMVYGLDFFDLLPSKLGNVYEYIVLFSIFFFVYFERSAWQGTPGKKMLGLKVEDLDGNRLSLDRACARYFWYIFPTMMYTIPVRLLGEGQAGGFLQKGLVFVTIAWVLAWCFPILFTKDKTGAYEMLSKTRVVREG